MECLFLQPERKKGGVCDERTASGPMHARHRGGLASYGGTKLAAVTARTATDARNDLKTHRRYGCTPQQKTTSTAMTHTHTHSRTCSQTDKRTLVNTNTHTCLTRRTASAGRLVVGPSASQEAAAPDRTVQAWAGLPRKNTRLAGTLQDMGPTACGPGFVLAKETIVNKDAVTTEESWMWL